MRNGNAPYIQIPVLPSYVGILSCVLGLSLAYWQVELASFFLVLGVVVTIRGNVAESTRDRLLKVCDEIITSRPDLTAQSTAEIAIDTIAEYRMMSAMDIRTVQRSRKYYVRSIVRHTSGQSLRASKSSRSGYIDQVIDKASTLILANSIDSELTPKHQEKVDRVHELHHQLTLLPENAGPRNEEERYRHAVALDKAVNEANRQGMRE